MYQDCLMILAAILIQYCWLNIVSIFPAFETRILKQYWLNIVSTLCPQHWNNIGSMLSQHWLNAVSIFYLHCDDNIETRLWLNNARCFISNCLAILLLNCSTILRQCCVPAGMFRIVLLFWLPFPRCQFLFSLETVSRDSMLYVEHV